MFSFLNSVLWHLHPLPRRLALFRALRGQKLQRQAFELTSTAGYKLAACLTFIPGMKDYFGLVISPAVHQGLHDLESKRSVVSPAELAALGYMVLSFDPSGRGESWGEEDFGGDEHQDNVRVAIEYLQQHPQIRGPIGVLALSMGVVAAVGACTRGPALPVAFLVDWEGPCDREILTAGGTIMVPAKGHRMTDDSYWHPREPVRQVAALTCPYIRLQALPDHAQPQEVRHAWRMMRAVEHSALPWWQLNDHPRQSLPERPVWLPGGPLAANHAILRKLRALYHSRA
jgi:hypothetical protein